MYFIKVGNLYITRDGTLSEHQVEALRVQTAINPVAPRFVKVRPHGSAPRNASQATDTEDPNTSANGR